MRVRLRKELPKEPGSPGRPRLRANPSAWVQPLQLQSRLLCLSAGIARRFGLPRRSRVFPKREDTPADVVGFANPLRPVLRLRIRSHAPMQLPFECAWFVTSEPTGSDDSSIRLRRETLDPLWSAESLALLRCCSKLRIPSTAQAQLSRQRCANSLISYQAR